MTIFAEARTACVARWGNPSEEHDGKKPKTIPQARWDVGYHEVILTDIPGVSLSLTLDMCGAPVVDWTLDGEPTVDAPLTDLTVALNAADTLLGRNQS